MAGKALQQSYILLADSHLECQGCGSVVRTMALHDAWHAQVGRPCVIAEAGFGEGCG